VVLIFPKFIRGLETDSANATTKNPYPNLSRAKRQESMFFELSVQIATELFIENALG
jgi:hypothetical protein